VDDRAQTFPAEDTEWVAATCARRTGVGSDGLLLIQPSDEADFRMRFYNPDGGEAEMCGNGARCVARLAHELGAAPERMRIQTVAGLLGAEIRGEQVLLHMTDPKGLRLNQALQLNGRTLDYHFVNTGVPHVVCPVDNVEDVDVAAMGAPVRYHADFAPAGTNVNFMSLSGENALRVRTYERGVEAETHACGTGMVACGLVAGLLGLVKPPARITPTSGDLLQVDYTDTDGRITAVTLLGPAEHVCEGVLTYRGNH
jgi:diaminopimelate epimerase